MQLPRALVPRAGRKFLEQRRAHWFGVCFTAALALIGAEAILDDASLARATVLRERSLEALTRESDAIVLGRVIASGSRLKLGTESPTVTVTRLEVARWVKGAGPAVIELEEMGGTVNRRTFAVDGAPAFRTGEAVLVFLSKHPASAGRYRTYGMSQGKFTLRYGAPGVPASLHRELGGVALLRQSAAGSAMVSGESDPDLTLDDTLAFIEDTLRPSAAGPMASPLQNPGVQ